jgi:hypothetical protein
MVVNHMEKYTKRVFVSVLLVVSIMLMSYGAVAVSASDSSVSGVSLGQEAQWSVTASSGVTATWYSETFMPRGNFSLPVGSTIDLTITSVVGGRFRGNISVGGLVLTNVSMTEISFNLLLGWYPFQPGLVSPINWNVQVQNATSNGFTVQVPLFGPTDTIVFDHLNGTVGTKLTYDRSTGLLLDGYGSFGQFTVEVALRSAFSPLSPTATMVVVIAAVSVVVAIVGGWYGTSRKSSR